MLNKLLKRRKTVVTVFIVITVLCAACIPFVSVNYNMVDYLPDTAKSTRALSEMEAEFVQTVPNAKAMIKNVSVSEALEYKQMISEVEGVELVMWLDDVVDVKQPLEVLDKDIVSGYYKNGSALIQIAIQGGKEADAVEDILELIGDENCLSGDAVDSAQSQSMSETESMKSMAILIPMLVIILIISTNHWLEPILYLAAIGISVLINMGTNIMFDNISYITFAISPILQMAVSLDYAIFLLHRFEYYRPREESNEAAMVKAMKVAFKSIIASAATTAFGFMALTFMNFKIGFDLGLNLVKGIVISFICVVVFMPCLTLLMVKLLDKTKHRSFIIEIKNIGKIVRKVKTPVFILVILIIVPSFVAQNSNSFIYGTSGWDDESRAALDTREINDVFGESVNMVLLVDKGDVAREKTLCDELSGVENVTSVVSYASMVGNVIPPGYLDESITSQFYSENYARIILYVSTPSESKEAFECVETVRGIAEKYYPEVLTCGQSANTYDIKYVVTDDSTRVNIINILAIGFVLLLTFRSISLPVMLIMTIETSIWMNLAIPYFTGTTLGYIGYLVMTTVQLGATVDYAILFTDNYLHNRKTLMPAQAVELTINKNLSSIMVSASILISAGIALNLVSSNAVIAQLGTLLSRGTGFSLLLVVFFLPGMLIIFDKVVEKTTLHTNFFKGGKKK
ncbi:MAG: RND family transporter [Ruminococcaceae bacterium]|nr:RND family transporter [Oscillospiraceae bacterium]